MSRVALWNLGGLVVALVLPTAAATGPALVGREQGSPGPVPAASAGPATLTDHDGVSVEVRDYRRIVGLSSIADALLLELCEPDRVVAVTQYSAERSPSSYRFHGKPELSGASQIEPILDLRPDLVLVSGIGDRRPIDRMRAAGLVVFDLGDMRGTSTLLANAREVATLVGHPERAERFARGFAARMDAVAADVPARARKRGMYLSAYGGRLYGGAEGTSYHDVLVAAGLVDAATGQRDWPEYDVEKVIALDPDVIVTNAGMRERVCGHAGLEKVRACARRDGIVEVDGALLGDPGPSMLDAAEAVRTAVYGAPRKDTPAKGDAP